MNNLNNTQQFRTNNLKGHISRFMLPLIFMFYVSGAQAIDLASDYTSVPPLIDLSGSGDKPNVLLVIDNSNSMDEAANGSAVGSDSEFSKSEIARGALETIINNFGDSSRLGLMAYKQSGISKRHIHNSPYDVSFDPNNFYNSATDGPIEDIPRDSHIKKYRIPNPTNPGAYIYYNIALPFYSGSNYGNAFCRSSTADFDNGSEVVGSGPWDSYQCYRNKTTASDSYSSGFSSYWFNSSFYPTDSDYAQGILDFGRFMSWHYVGRTWFSNSSPGKGMLHAEIKDVTTSHKADLLAKLAKSQFSTTTDTPLRNAGLTPIEGTLKSAKSYFQGSLPSSERVSGLSGSIPSSNVCTVDNDYVVLVTDGLPSVDASGNQTSNTSAAITAAAAAAADLLSSQNVKTFVVGFALPNGVDASVLDQIAIAGGTNKAYSASDEVSLNKALGSIFLSIINRTSSSTGTAVLANNTRGEGAVFQASFNPRMEDANGNSVNWVGGLQGLFIDQLGFFREDTNGNKALDGYDTDNIVKYFYDSVENRARIKVYAGTSATIAPDTTGTPTSIKEVSDLKVIWQARDQLAELTDTTTQRDFTDSAGTGRHILTSITGTSLIDFTALSSAEHDDAEAAALEALNLANSDLTFATTGLSGATLNKTITAAALVEAEAVEGFRRDVYNTINAFYNLEQALLNGNASQIALAQAAVDDVIANKPLLANLVLADQAKQNAIDTYDAAVLVYDDSVVKRADKEALEAAALADFNIATTADTNAYNAYINAVAAANTAKTTRDNAVIAATAAQTNFDNADTAFNVAEAAFNTALTNFNTAFTARTDAVYAASVAQTDYDTANLALIAAQIAYDSVAADANTALTKRDNAVTAAAKALSDYNTAVAALPIAQTAYDDAVTASNAAQLARDNAVTAAATAQTNYDNSANAVFAAQLAYDNAVTATNAPRTARDNAVIAAATAQTDYNAALLAAGGNLLDPSVVTAQAVLDAANALVVSTNADLTNANQVVADRQGDLDAATTARSNALSVLNGANALVISTNTDYVNASNALIDRQNELTAATAAIPSALSDLDNANALVITTNADLDAANLIKADKQTELDAAKTARSDASDLRDAANLLVTSTNEALTIASQTRTDRETDLNDATIIRTNALSALNAANSIVSSTNIALTTADLAVTTQQGILTTATAALSAASDAYYESVTARKDAETEEETALAEKDDAADDVVTATDAANAADQAQNSFYGEGLLNIDTSDLAGELALASANLAPPTEALIEAQTNASQAVSDLANAQAALTAATTAQTAAQAAYDAAVLAILDHNVFLNYLMESSGTESNKLVNYIRGEEQAGYRSRTIDIDGDGDTEVWRLGDIVNSTPALVGAPASSYDALHGDSTYAVFREHYKNRRQMVYIGANDGMLHAFNAGFWNESDKKFELDNSFLTGSSSLTQHPLGSEVWSYVPRSALAHLKWLKDPGYAHTYYVDGEPITFDANIFPVDADHPYGWGTVLAIGLRLGGGTINVDTDGDSVNDTQTHSSYILMDVTNPEKPPELIAEVSHSQLGFTTSKPAVLKNRVSGNAASYTTTTTNSWHLVFGSGPTELSDITSTQNAKLFVYDLVAKSFVTGFEPNNITTETNSFVGDISVANWENDYVDDTVYFGVVGGTPSSSTGKVMRYRVDESSATAISTFLDTGKATVAKPLPVVDGNGRKWLYFGTGRLFDGSDNGTTQLQNYYGVMEPVDTIGETTWAAVSNSTLQDVSNVKVFSNGDVTMSSGTLEIPTGTTITTFDTLKSAISAHKGGWFRKLYNVSPEPTGRNLTSTAKSSSIVFFTEYKPADNSCQPEGTSSLYGVDYQTGTAVPFAVFGTDSSVTNNDGELSLTSVDLGQGNSSSPVVVSNNSSAVTGTSDTVVSVITQLSSEVTRADSATTGVYSRSRESWMQIQLD